MAGTLIREFARSPKSEQSRENGRVISRHRCSSVCLDDDDDDERALESTRLLSQTSSINDDPSGRRYRSISSGSGHGASGNVEDQLTLSGSHCHDKIPEKVVDIRARRKLIIASILCLIFMLAEALGGIFAHSLAILADAAHMLTDFASFMISLLALFLSSRPATKKMSFGWYRAEIIGALISVLFIWVVTGILVYIAVLRIVEDDYEINASIMLITAGCGVAVNIVMGLTLHQHGHSHHHGNSNHSHMNHDDSESAIESSDLPHVETRKSKTNINVRAAFIHALGDLCQSIGVLIAAYIIYYKPEWKIVDPICTFLFSGLVLVTTITILRDILLVLMEGTPRGISFTEVKQSFYQIEGVKEVHNLRVWSLTLDKTALSAHIAVDKSSDPHVILKKASSMVQRRYGITESTIQIEEYVDEMLDCTQCKGPKD